MSARTSVKDGINNCVVQGNQAAVNPEKQGTKVAAHYRVTIASGQSATVRLRLTARGPAAQSTTTKGDAVPFGPAFDAILAARLQEADEFYRSVTPPSVSPDAAWDLAFHTLPLSIVDPEFAKEQMELMLRDVYLHPSGQMPAYEWNFSEVNPPINAFATLFLHRTEQALRGEADVDFLKSAFNKLLLNFTWWVNRKDRFGKNVFEGAFLGLDNIGVFDRSGNEMRDSGLYVDLKPWKCHFSQVHAL